MEQETASLVKVTSPKSRKNKNANIEIRNGIWYLLPGTILLPTKPKFQEHKRRDSIAEKYGKKLEDGSIVIVEECSVPSPLSAWHLVQGNSDTGLALARVILAYEVWPDLHQAGHRNALLRFTLLREEVARSGKVDEAWR